MDMLQTGEKDAHTFTHSRTSTYTRTLARKRHERGKRQKNRTRERDRERERERGKSGSKRDNQESQQYKAWATCNRYTAQMVTLRCQHVGDMHAQ